MSGYRLHIDIPVGQEEEAAILWVNEFVRHMEGWQNIISERIGEDKPNTINYRLGHDEDRQKSNYLNKTENGHVTNKKLQLTFPADLV